MDMPGYQLRHQDRASTKSQALEKEGCEIIYKDKFTGTKTDRREFCNKLIRVLKRVTH